MTSDFSYKKYSLENLENWMYDAMSSAEASPQEIYDVIVGVVKDNYYAYKQQASQAYELLALLNGNGQSYEDVIKEKEYYEPSMPPWGHSDLEYGLQYTDEEINAMCESAEEQEKEKHSEHYYDYSRNDLNRKNPFLTYDEAVAAGWTMTDDGFWMPPQEKKKWVLPVEECKDADTDETEYFVSFPQDLLEAAKLKEGDEVCWVDNNDGTYTIQKKTKPLEMNEC